MQPLRVPSVGRHGPPPHQPSIRSSQLYPLNTPEDPTGPQTESPRGSREPTSAIRGPRPEGARRPKRPKTNSNPPTPNHTAAVPDHHRPLTAARAMAEGATPGPRASPRRARRRAHRPSRTARRLFRPGPVHVRCPVAVTTAAPPSVAATPAQESHEARRRAGPLGACRGTPRRFAGFLPLIHLGHIAHSRTLPGSARGAGIPSHGGPSALGRAHRHRRNDRSRRSRRTSALPDGARSASSVSSSRPWPGVPGGPTSLFATGARAGTSWPPS